MRSISWKVWLGADNARELGCERPGSEHAGWRCLYSGRRRVAAWRSASARQRRFLVSPWPRPTPAPGRRLRPRHDYRVGGGGELSLLGGAGDRWRFEPGARSAYFFLGQRGLVLRTHAAQSILLTRRFALRASFDTTGDYAQGTGGVAYF